MNFPTNAWLTNSPHFSINFLTIFYSSLKEKKKKTRFFFSDKFYLTKIIINNFQ